jgi:type 1 fimbriae regulatory protein FimB/type 1 fimbriae regulatory protein FimE
LTELEIERLRKQAKSGPGRYGHRDSTMILLAFRHALRVTELVNLKWTDVDFTTGRLNVRRLKGSISGEHPIRGDELRALRELRRQYPESPYLFATERKGPMTAAGFRKLLSRLAVRAGMADLKVHPHALRHSTGHALVNKGTDTRTLQGYMGHAQIANTVKYTHLDARRYDGIWDK